MQRKIMSSRHRHLRSFNVNPTANMFSEEDLTTDASGPTILDLKVAGTKAGLSYATDWSLDALTRICKAHDVHPGPVNDKETLLAMLEKSLTQPVVCEEFELQDLSKFIEARGLNAHRSSTNTMMTRSDPRDASHLQQLEWKKATLGGTDMSAKRSHEGTDSAVCTFCQHIDGSQHCSQWVQCRSLYIQTCVSTRRSSCHDSSRSSLWTRAKQEHLDWFARDS